MLYSTDSSRARGRGRRLLSALFALLLLAAVPAAAETTPEAKKWLDKLTGTLKRGPFTTDLAASFDLTGEGSAIKGSLSGRVTYGDADHTRLEMQLEVAGIPGLSQGPEPIRMDLTNVNDGAVNWTEVYLPSFNSRQVTKVAREDAARIAEQQAAAGFAPTAIDPVAQLDALVDGADFTLVGVAGGKATLRGKIKEEHRAELGQLAAAGSEELTLVLDERTGFPVEVRSGGAQPIFKMELRNTRFVERAALPAGAFVYTPPPGAVVTDLGEVTPPPVQ